MKPTMDINLMKFCGMAMKCSEEELGISLMNGEAQVFVESLYPECLSAKIPERQRRRWL